MHSDVVETHPMLKLGCKKCGSKFYWGAVYGGVSALTKCPTCKTSKSQDFSIIKRICDGTAA